MSASMQVRGLTMRFGGVVAIDNLDAQFPEGSISGVIGPNGAGKSTLMGLLSGALRPSAGRIEFGGRDVSTQSAAARARMGIGRTYQVPRPFLDMSVEENLAVAQVHRGAVHWRLAAKRRLELLSECGLVEQKDWMARQLPLLRRKRLEVARALALEPRLLLLDEVGAGLIDAEVSELIALIKAVSARGTTIVLVEHVLRVVRECCSSLLVLNFGRHVASGNTSDVLASVEVAAIYLGTAHRAATAARAAITDADSAAVAVPAVTTPALDTDVLVDSRPAESQSLLVIENLQVAYGQVNACRDVNLTVGVGEVVAVLGANGAGKTSLAQAISGALTPAAGRIVVAGQDVSGQRADEIARLGIAHCMEGRRIFPNLTVEQNLSMAARGVASSVAAARLQSIYGLFPILAERRLQGGTALSGGQQQMLAIGRALMARPRLVIFDEISLGLAPIVMDQLYQALAVLKRAGLAMLIVEQDVERALALADRAYVLEHGSVGLAGSAASVRADARLHQLYLGSPEA